ncbi:hypothetical protein JCM10213v2_005287 [Rhodosporidiobolus nylandii]
MRTATSFSLTSALLLASPFASAIPTLPRRTSLTEAVPAPSAAAATQAAISGNTKIALHRRGSAELMREDGTIDLNKAHYVRGLENFERNTGKALFLAPSLVDPSLLPSISSDIADSLEADLTQHAAWGSGEESSLDWDGDAAAAAPSAARLARRADVDKVFDLSVRRKGVPGVVANKRAIEKRVVKNPKVVYNPKAHTSTSTAAAAAQTGGVSLSDYQDGTLWYGTISIGTPAKNYIIDFDTGSADLWIPSTNCTSAACNTHSKYDPSTSSTSASLPTKKLSITYGDGSSTKGTVWTDTVSIAGLTAVGQTFGAAYSLTSDFQDDPYDGLMGMAYGSISTMGATPLFETLVNEKKVAKSQFSFLLAQTGSELFMGGMNAAHYAAGSTKWYPVASQSYWLLATQANVGDTAVSSLGTFNSIVDTGTSVIVAPTDAAAKFWASVPNSAAYGGAGGYYSMPCDEMDSVDISFSFGTSDKWVVSGASLNLGRVSSGSSRCVGAVVGADIGLGATWILGAAFLENVYSTFDVSTNSVGFSDLA